MPSYEYDDDDDDEQFDYGSLDPVQQQTFLFEQLGFQGAPRDMEARDLFRAMMYDDDLTGPQRLDIETQFVGYIWDEYGINFWEVWDWEDFRAWYG